MSIIPSLNVNTNEVEMLVFIFRQPTSFLNRWFLARQKTTMCSKQSKLKQERLTVIFTESECRLSCQVGTEIVYGSCQSGRIIPSICEKYNAELPISCIGKCQPTSKTGCATDSHEIRLVFCNNLFDCRSGKNLSFPESYVLTCTKPHRTKAPNSVHLIYNELIMLQI